MTETEPNLGSSKYFRRLNPSDIVVNKDDLFYRDKFNEILNYIKTSLTNTENIENAKYFVPKGALLINVNANTDILDFFKLIANNYYLDYYELNLLEFIKSPDDFYKNYFSFLTTLNNKINVGPGKLAKKSSHSKEEDDTYDSTKEKKTELTEKKVLILINEDNNFKRLSNNKNLLQDFVFNFLSNYSKSSFIDRNVLLVWINYDYENIVKISNDLFNVFDFLIKIPMLNKAERETVLRTYCEKNPKIVFDVNLLVNKTEDWEVKDIKQLLKLAVFKHFTNSELNEVSNEITDILIGLIDSGEFFVPKIVKEAENSGLSNQESEGKPIKAEYSKDLDVKQENAVTKEILINSIKNEGGSEFMLNQLYENAAFKNYNELLLIIDKLSKKEILEENDRKLLSKFPFVLNETPTKAQLNLEKAKKRVDLMTQSFGK